MWFFVTGFGAHCDCLLFFLLPWLLIFTGLCLRTALASELDVSEGKTENKELKAKYLAEVRVLLPMIFRAFVIHFLMSGLHFFRVVVWFD